MPQTDVHKVRKTTTFALYIVASCFYIRTEWKVDNLHAVKGNTTELQLQEIEEVDMK